jgi:hypothetical protein
MQPQTAKYKNNVNNIERVEDITGPLKLIGGTG